MGIEKILTFPHRVMEGSLGELARELSKGTEVPEEFIFATALTGALRCDRVGTSHAKLGMDSDTRLFTVLLGKSWLPQKKVPPWHYHRILP